MSELFRINEPFPETKSLPDEAQIDEAVAIIRAECLIAEAVGQQGSAVACVGLSKN